MAKAKKPKNQATDKLVQNALAIKHWIQLTHARATELELIGLHDAAGTIRQLANRSGY